MIKINKLTQSQQKTLIAGAIIVAIFFLAWMLLYFPQAHKLNSLKSEFAATQIHIRQIETMMAADKNFGSGLELLIESLNKLNSKFPQTEKESLQAISDLARKVNLNVVSTQSQPKTSFLDAQSQLVEIEGKKSQMVSVSVELKGNFKDFGKFLLLLKTALPAYVSLEHVSLQSDGALAPILSISLVLNLYLLT